MKKFVAILLMLVLAATMCTALAEEKTYTIGMSQCNLGEPWRVAMNDQIAAAAAEYPMFEVIYADAAQDNSKQIADIENFIQMQVDLIIASPNEATPLTNVIKRAYESGIPVILLDRKIDGDTQRTARQRKVIEAAYHKVMTLDLASITALVLENLDAFKTDLTPADAVTLIPLAIRCKNATFETLTIPKQGMYSTRTIDGMWVIVPNLKQNKALLQEFLGLKEE